VITGDLFNMFVFLEIASISGVVLAAIPRKGDEQGLNWRGAAVYAVVGTVASFLVLAGIGLLYGSTSTLNIAQMAERVGEIDVFVAGAAFLLMLVGFGIEAELFPLNGWAPEVYRGSRWGTGSIFSTVIGKAGLLALIRITFLIVGPVLEGEVAMEILLYAGVATYLFGEAAAFTSKDLYRILGYSSVGMFGLLIASFSIGTADGMRAGTMLLLGHLIAKPLLFSMVSHVGEGYKGDVPMTSLRGLIRSSPTTGILMTIGILALIGMPPSPTFWGKFLFFSGAGSEGLWLVAVIVGIGTLLEAGYLGRLLFGIYSVEGRVRRRPLGAARGVMGMTAAVIVLLLGLFPDTINGIIEQVIEELMDPMTYIGWGVI
jgi:formate hydrogenlyase subunit 3/multisubunit Na+/H+ antiporter MnhD subunit